MVAINSIPQQEVANGRGQSELALAKPITASIFVAKNPGPSSPSGDFAISSFVFLMSSAIVQVFAKAN
jgi:hypothetical protein